MSTTCKTSHLDYNTTLTYQDIVICGITAPGFNPDVLGPCCAMLPPSEPYEPASTAPSPPAGPTGPPAGPTITDTPPNPQASYVITAPDNCAYYCAVPNNNAAQFERCAKSRQLNKQTHHPRFAFECERGDSGNSEWGGPASVVTSAVVRAPAATSSKAGGGGGGGVTPKTSKTERKTSTVVESSSMATSSAFTSSSMLVISSSTAGMLTTSTSVASPTVVASSAAATTSTVAPATTTSASVSAAQTAAGTREHERRIGWVGAALIGLLASRVMFL